MELTINGAGDAVDRIRAENQAILPSDMEVVRTTKSASIRIKDPPIDRFENFVKQLEAVRAGLAAAVRLLALAPRIQS